MKFKVTEAKQIGAIQISLLCPYCHQVSILQSIAQDIVIGNEYICGQRKCPDPNCNGHLFVVIRKGQLIASYPPSRADFNPENIPERITALFDEALDCHASGYSIAAAIMIRRTLEEICDERGAKGKNLKERIKALGSKIIIPQELIDGMNELRLLGNDATHVNAKTYTDISNEELEVAIEFSKEILKSLYQYSALLEKLRSLKKDESA